MLLLLCCGCSGCCCILLYLFRKRFSLRTPSSWRITGVIISPSNNHMVHTNFYSYYTYWLGQCPPNVARTITNDVRGIWHVPHDNPNPNPKMYMAYGMYRKIARLSVSWQFPNMPPPPLRLRGPPYSLVSLYTCRAYGDSIPTQVTHSFQA